jgi:photosystem II stability/assembly factor-like uncharacterized protein
MKRALPALALTCIASATTLAQPVTGPKFLAFAFTTNDHGWAAGSDGIDVTQDGGRSWQPQYRGRRVDELVIVRRRCVYALADGVVLHTTDDGVTWEVSAQPQPALAHIAFTSERDGFAIGVDGLLYATADGAKTWHRGSFDRPLSALCFSDPRTGFVGGALSAPALGAFDGIASTHDGGRTWAQTTRPPTDGLIGIAGHTLHCTRGSVTCMRFVLPVLPNAKEAVARKREAGGLCSHYFIDGEHTGENLAHRRTRKSHRLGRSVGADARAQSCVTTSRTAQPGGLCPPGSELFRSRRSAHGLHARPSRLRSATSALSRAFSSRRRSLSGVPSTSIRFFQA